MSFLFLTVVLKALHIVTWFFKYFIYVRDTVLFYKKLVVKLT